MKLINRLFNYPEEGSNEPPDDPPPVTIPPYK